MLRALGVEHNTIQQLTSKNIKKYQKNIKIQTSARLHLSFEVRSPCAREISSKKALYRNAEPKSKGPIFHKLQLKEGTC